MTDIAHQLPLTSCFSSAALLDLFDASHIVICLVSAGATHVLLLGTVGWAHVSTGGGWTQPELWWLQYSCPVLCGISATGSCLTSQAALTSMPKINCLDILQGYHLIQTVLVTEHN